MEHAKFFVMLMPGPELEGPRAQAEQFQRTFAQHFERLRAARIDGQNVADLNRSTIELARPFIDFKHHPALADHVRREAVKFIDELKRAV